MPFPVYVARALNQLLVPPEKIRKMRNLVFQDAGHGFDPFGMHPEYVSLGTGIAGPLYRRWFRVTSRGAEHIPKRGPAILAGNHSGTVPTDAMMLWMDVIENTDPPRVARPVADHFVPMLPYVGTLFARAGMVGGSRGNARKLLENGDILMIFPEGVPGIGKPYRDRYQLQEWRVGHAELAIRHRAPVVPVAIIGAEEQMPQVARIEGISAFGIPYLPITLSPLPLPVRYRFLYGPPIPLHRDHAPEEADDPQVVEAAARRVRDAVDALLQEGLRERDGRIFS